MIGITELVDSLALMINIAMLYIFGYYDKKYRILPFIPFLFYLGLSIAFVGIRFYIAPPDIRSIMIASLIVSGGLLAALVPVAIYSNMLGIGDILAILASALMTPYPPLGEKIRALPILIPLSAVVAVLLIFIIRRKITIVKPDFPPGYRRVIRVRASWLKKQEVLKAYPVYVPGYGFVYEEIFKADDPREATRKLLDAVPDETVIYVLPNFPFVYYYFIAFTIVSVALLIGGVLEMVLG